MNLPSEGLGAGADSPEVSGGLVLPGELGIDPQISEGLTNTSGSNDYMPMSVDEFLRFNPSKAKPEDRIRNYRMLTRMVRDRRETPEARKYFDGIEEAFEESFRIVTPELLRDPTKMNLIRCVDPYTKQQLEELSFDPGEEMELPGGLLWFYLTGTLQEWIIPRIFNERLVASLHRDCGGAAIVGALTGERQAALRDRATQNATRIVAETAAYVIKKYFEQPHSQDSDVDPNIARIMPTFSGPKLIFPTGSEGTAENLITPIAIGKASIKEQFKTKELVHEANSWASRKLETAVSE